MPPTGTTAPGVLRACNSNLGLLTWRRGRVSGFDHERRRTMGQPVVHWEIMAKDAEKAKEFYSKLFGWTISVQQPMNYGLVKTGGQGGIDGGIFAREGVPPYVTFYVQVDDLQAALNNAKILGGKTVMGTIPIPSITRIQVVTHP